MNPRTDYQVICLFAGTPEESGISLEVVEKLSPEFPLFGVCLGHQCIGQIFGGDVDVARLAAPSAI